MPASDPQRNIRLLYAYWFLRDFHLWIPVWIVFLTVEQGFSLTQVTIAEGLYLVGVVGLEVPTGAIADRWGRSRSLALGALCMGGAVLIFALTTTFPVLITSFMLWSLATTLMSGADNALLYDTLRESGREAQYERTAGRGVAFIWAGAGLATFAGGPVAGALDIRATIFMGALTTLITAAVALLIREPSRPPSPQGERYVASIRAAFSEVRRAPELRRGILLSGAGVAAIEAVHYLVQPYLLNRGIEVGTMFSLLQVPMIFAGAGGALAAAGLLARRGDLWLLRIIPMLGAGTYLALVVSPGLSAYVALPVLFALGATLMPVGTGYINRRVDSERRATILSMQGMATSLLLAVLTPSLGFVTDRWGLAQAFALGGVICVSTVLLFGMPERTRVPMQAQQPSDA